MTEIQEIPVNYPLWAGRWEGVATMLALFLRRYVDQDAEIAAVIENFDKLHSEWSQPRLVFSQQQPTPTRFAPRHVYQPALTSDPLPPRPQNTCAATASTSSDSQDGC